MDMRQVTLDDKYTLSAGSVYMSGTQALVRLPLVQRCRDMAAGLNTGGFISGYRGSPLGAYDQALDHARHTLTEHDIVFRHGVNEDLAATMVWGSQQLNLFPKAKKDGVFGIWYGKGPGVDRSGDVFRHANAAGTSKYGGVLAIAGDDHGAKSSTLPHQTDHTFYGLMMPILYPSSVHEYVEYGLLGFAMSRYSGCWVAFKVLSETIEVTASVSLAGEQRQILLPGDDDFAMPPSGVNIRILDDWKDQDFLLQRYKVFAALAFAKKNHINRIVWDSPCPRFGIITSGKSYEDVRQALDEIGITAEIAARIGLRLYKVGMPWPLEPDGVRHFSEGLEEVLVVEEKRELIENQIKQQLFNWRADVRPLVVGKVDEKGDWLLHPENDLSVGEIAHVIAARLSRFYHSERVRERLAYYSAREAAQKAFAPAITRKPYFCSGCPHNTSTKVPAGSRALAGIGCHIMATWMHRNTMTFTQMGGEGTPWCGQAPFTEERHVFANLGDGTYYHSGLLAIRQSVAAGVNITYKILFNDAIAMTGGQEFDGPLSVPLIARQVAAEGVKRIVVVTDEPAKYDMGGLPSDIAVHHRDELETLQRQLREQHGVTILIYDQTCAAEKRRRRKRGSYPDPNKRVFINELVCEGCGDCSAQSNCVSVEPLETEFGRKRIINQSTCNKDYSCLKGFCPSFVTVYGGRLKKTEVTGFDDLLRELPTPATSPSLVEPYNIFITGIGGTGVVTIGALLGMAAHLEGKAVSVLDMAGLAQKGGAVFSYVRFGAPDSDLHAPKISTGDADALIACDAVVAASPAGVDIISKERTAAVINTHRTPVADFVLDKDVDFRDTAVRNILTARTRDDVRAFIDASLIATALFGDSIATNMFMLGYAYQRGLAPVSADAIERAIELNGVAIEMNVRAFRSGRLAAHDEAAITKLMAASLLAAAPMAQTLDEIIDRRAQYLTSYQNRAYAERYLERVERVRAAERQAVPGSTELTDAVARGYFKLLAYKDEYEVARLYAESGFIDRVKAQFAGDVRLEFNLAPPFLSRPDPTSGRPKKRRFGSWILIAFKILSKFKGLRGTPLDPFGYAEERKLERALIAEYEADMATIIATLDRRNHDQAVALARLPQDIRGFGSVKAAAVDKARARRRELLSALTQGAAPQRNAA